MRSQRGHSTICPVRRAWWFRGRVIILDGPVHEFLAPSNLASNGPQMPSSAHSSLSTFSRAWPRGSKRTLTLTAKGSSLMPGEEMQLGEACQGHQAACFPTGWLPHKGKAAERTLPGTWTKDSVGPSNLPGTWKLGGPQEGAPRPCLRKPSVHVIPDTKLFRSRPFGPDSLGKSLHFCFYYLKTGLDKVDTPLPVDDPHDSSHYGLIRALSFTFSCRQLCFKSCG